MDRLDEVNLIYSIITHPAGFDVDIGGSLTIRRYEHPQWVVEWEEYFNPHAEPKSLEDLKEFDDPMAAAVFFVEKRHELALGLDFEVSDGNINRNSGNDY